MLKKPANGLPRLLRLRSPDSASAAITGSSCGTSRSAAARAIQRASAFWAAASPG